MSFKNKLILFLFAIGCISFLQSQAQPQTAKEKKSAQLKTAYIYQFTRYVFWPNEAQMKEFVICVMSSEGL
ncbi:MAG: DUF4154 domain-containing protein, partial [Bacteroidia bacterium]|nr:DUF4154 domain-containing protein [Bacteroidia bacterium]